MSVNILQEGDLVSITGWPGHQILNNQGDTFPQRNKIQFKNSTIRDDITNNITVITPQGGGSGSDPATPDDLGIVKPDNTTITVDQNGVISAAIPSVATTQAAGVVKPDGTTITIEQDGTLHGVSSTPIATDQTVGTVKPDGTTITIDQNGTISAAGSSTPIATLAAPGIVMPDGVNIGINTSTGLLNLDPGKRKLDRKRIFINGMPTSATVTAQTSPTIAGPGQSRTTERYTFPTSGIYFVSANGNMSTSHKTFYDFYLKLRDSSNQEYIINQYTVTNQYNQNTEFAYDINTCGICIAKAGDKLITIEENDSSSASGAISCFYGYFYVTLLYSCADPASTQYWWQEETY